MTTGQLCEIGGRLGADIPFCIVGGASLVGGIGDRLEEIPSMPACYLVVASMGEGVSTPWAYGKLDERYENFSGEKSSGQVPDGVLSGMKAQHLQTCCTGFYNMFEEVVPETRPWVDTLKRTMLECGAITSMMSGSGPSVFGVFETAELAQKAAEALQSIGIKGFVCHPCAKYPI
jgi:4-diphosphocytidyl-2-C-methyl-D-erythritol kinase